MPEQASSQPRIELLFEKFSSFVDGYASNLSLGGMFLETGERREVDSLVDFEIKLTDGFCLIQGLGEVVWVRPQSAAERPAGMAVRFQALDDKGRELVLKILEEQVRGGGEPFDVEEVPADLELEPVEDTSPGPDEALAAGEDEPQETPLDLEQKILGEDGFTLLDTEEAVPAPGLVQPDKTFEELAFDAPWGEKLPEIPQEVLEEGLNDGVTLLPPGMAGAEPSAATAREESLPPEPLPPEAAEEISEVADPFAALAEIEGTFGQGQAGAAVAADAMAPDEALEASLFLAEEAADEIELTPQAEALAEPEFDDIDFGVPDSGEDDLVADFVAGVPAAGVPAAGVPGAAFEDAFEPGIESPLPSLEADSGSFDESTGGEEAVFADDPFGEDATLVTADSMAPESVEEDAALLSADLLAPEPAAEEAALLGADLLAPEPAAEDATLLTAEPLAPEPAAEDATLLTAEPLVPETLAEDATLLTADLLAPEPAAEDAALLTAEPLAPEPPEPPVASWMPEPPPAVLPPPAAEVPVPANAESVSPPAAGAGTVTVGGAPVGVQDYEDDLFAEDPPAGSFQVLRKALGGRSILVALALGLLAALGYFFRGPLAELAGLAEPAADSAAVASAAGTTDRQQTQAAPESSPTATPVTQDGELAEPGAEAIEEVEVQQSLPVGVDVSNDPAAEVTDAAPAVEMAMPTLAPATSPAARVERISWRRGDRGTLVTVALDGDLDESRSFYEPLGYNPTREMVRITGIVEPYASGRIAVGSAEVQQIRIGHHVKPGGGELHIVFDYSDAGPQVAEVQNLGDRLEILISNR